VIIGISEDGGRCGKAALAVAFLIVGRAAFSAAKLRVIGKHA
jgi:hypothetical protein